MSRLHALDVTCPQGARHFERSADRADIDFFKQGCWGVLAFKIRNAGGPVLSWGHGGPRGGVRTEGQGALSRQEVQAVCSQVTGGLLPCVGTERWWRRERRVCPGPAAGAGAELEGQAQGVVSDVQTVCTRQVVRVRDRHLRR